MKPALHEFLLVIFDTQARSHGKLWGIRAKKAKEAEPVAERDPLASTEEEDPNAGFVPRNFTELDRLQFTVLAIENDCHILPKGSVKLTELHEVRRNNAFRGLAEDAAFDIHSYSHFRNV